MQAEMDTGLTDWMRAREAGEQLTEETLVEVIAAVIRPSSVSGGSVGGSAQMGDYMPGTRPFELEHDWMEVDSVEDALRAFVDVATEVPQEIVDEVLGEMMARRATT